MIMREFFGKTVLVVGLARSGIAASLILSKLGAKVLANDQKDLALLGENIEDLKKVGVELCLNMPPEDLVEKVDTIVISPGVSIFNRFVELAKQQGKEVISEVELAFRLCDAPIVAITGTNGKTTTTALTGEIFKLSGRRTYVVGNIGMPFISYALEMSKKDIAVAEISSFQLEAIRDFRPHISAILNITEDHIDRHRTFENYVNVKSRIVENSTITDFVVLNADDSLSDYFATKTQAKVMLFSRKKVLERGAWLEGVDLVFDIGDGKKKVCTTNDLLIPGEHNIENALAAILISALAKVKLETIAEALKKFKGVEHRIEMVDCIQNISFYNDSKGTNPDASIKAIRSMKNSTILIAGGYDKGSNFDDFIQESVKSISHLIVLGETADKITLSANKADFFNVHKVSNMQEAVKKAFDLAQSGENVLLSPACASWDMFKDFEDRGNVFKSAVFDLRAEYE